jgi:hypothetical protein
MGFAVLAVVLLALLGACGRVVDPFAGADAFVEEYMSVLMEGKPEATFLLEYASVEFGADAADLRPRYWIDFVDDYVVRDKEQINGKLFAYTVLMASSENPDEYRKLYLFPIQIDGVFYIAEAPSAIPDELRENFDATKYEFSDPKMNYAQPQGQ